ncbi:hypothetical protein JTE90_014454 [Oedothorax gibbosus]|uniref:Uncharacterized protein n=1 Tax=Oedothorax gibbosus TaxID=931172 RepID=A0AAV6V0N8_9ARAC|nr:hypothetical protein JTE90_014454 [Oedothorax gibbosus]
MRDTRSRGRSTAVSEWSRLWRACARPATARDVEHPESFPVSPPKSSVYSEISSAEAARSLFSSLISFLCITEA